MSLAAGAQEPSSRIGRAASHLAHLRPTMIISTLEVKTNALLVDLVVVLCTLGQLRHSDRPADDVARILRTHQLPVDQVIVWRSPSCLDYRRQPFLFSRPRHISVVVVKLVLSSCVSPLVSPPPQPQPRTLRIRPLGIQ